MARPIMVILGGGAGKGLYPLTKTRSKAAVPFGTKYRLVDIAISNCINSEYYQIFVLTQFNSGSVNRHIVQTYQIPPFLDGFVDPRAASLTADNRHWYQGTADAVRQNLGTICGAAEISNAQQVMIVSGDHLYHMDYRKVMDFHLKKGADVTLCVNPVQRDRASTLGIAQWDDDHRVTRFVEKPKDGELIDSLQIPHDAEEFPGAFLGSMGLYVFEIEWLKQFLTDHSDRHEFGRDFLPGVVGSSRVFAYAFEDYWENVGDIRSYYDAMMQLCKPNPRFDFDPVINNHRHRLFTRGRSLPPAKINGATFENAMIAEGAILEVRTQISNSLVGMRAFIDTDVVIEDSILFGCDEYEAIPERQRRFQAGEIPLGIGSGSRLSRCIIDKNVRIGRNVILENRSGVMFADAEKYSIRDGIIVVPRDTVIEDNFRIE